MNRKQAIALLNELGNNQLVDPSFIVIELAKPDSYQIRIKGNYDLNSLETFLKNNKVFWKENNDYLIISDPQ